MAPVSFLDKINAAAGVDFAKVASINFVAPVVSADPTGYEAGLIYNSTEKALKFHNGTSWVTLGVAGAGGPPSGAASGDLTGSYPNPQIAPGVIVDADVSASAAIAQSKISGLGTSLAGKTDTSTVLTAGSGLTGGGDLTAGRTFNVGAGTGITVNTDDIAVNRTVTDTWYVDTGGDTMTGLLTLSGDPTNPLHAATKQYVDLTAQGLDFKNSVKAASTANLTLSGAQTVDGVALVANDRVLVKDQSTASQNGIYLVAAGAWTRTTDADANGEISDGTIVPVEQGTTNGDSLYLCTATGATPWVAGTSTSTWTRFSSMADLTAGAGLTKTGNQIDVVSATGDLTVGADSLTINSAPKWSAARTQTLSGDVTGSASVDGSANWTITTAIAAGAVVDADVNASANIAQSKISGLTTSLSGKVDTSRQVIAGAGLTGGGALTADATLNVVGDATLNVAADQISVVSAPKWTTGRTIALTGDVTGTSAAFDGTGNLSIATTLVGGTTLVKHFAGNVGAGTSVAVTHNLGTRDVNVQVYDNTTFDTVFCDVRRTDINTVTLGFATAVAANAYRVVVQGR